MDSVVVRDFWPEDAEAVFQLYKQSSECFENLDVNPEFILDSARREDFHFLVAETGGKVIGFSGVLFYKSVGRAELGPLGVSREHQGQGIGSRLVERTLNYLMERGIRRVTAKSKTSNNNAVDFFINQGFQFEAYLRRYTKNNEDTVQLVYFI